MILVIIQTGLNLGVVFGPIGYIPIGISKIVSKEGILALKQIAKWLGLFIFSS